MTNTSKYSEAGVRRRSFKIGVLQNYAIFTGKQLCWSLFLIKNLIKTGVFLWILGNFYEFFIEHLWRLLLNITALKKLTKL